METRTLIRGRGRRGREVGGGEGRGRRGVGVYSYTHVLPDRFLFKLINLNLISKETHRAEHEYMNIYFGPA